MKTVLGVLLVILSGCSTTPEVIYRTVEVEMPVQVACVDHETIPENVISASEVVRGSDSPGEKIRAVLIEREQLRLANRKMRVLLKGCSL